MGFLMPMGILAAKMSGREENRLRGRGLFYVHVILQVVAVLVATAGAILSIKTFENSFNNYHQRIGLALYVAIWIQAIIGLSRPHRGTKKRTTWYFAHWILGTTISLLGIINIYSGIMAYHDKTSKRTWLWTVLFTAQVVLIAFLYLIIDKWDYLWKQGRPRSNRSSDQLPVISASDQALIVPGENQKQLMLLEPCGKRNALKNLFDS
ncbi:cytochrome b561 domain-containing protein At4g18260 isoform X2 [Punica granatum]|nr:cytochrome b561 domain-containing protein At4g18260 isoform X2 [Punica granatum]